MLLFPLTDVYTDNKKENVEGAKTTNGTNIIVHEQIKILMIQK